MWWKEQKCHQPGETWIASPQSLPLHHTRPVHNIHALSRPTTAVLNWTISRRTRKTAEPKQAACCKQSRGTVTFHPGDTAVPAGTSLQRGGDGEGEK